MQLMPETFFLLILDTQNWVFSLVDSQIQKWMFLIKNTVVISDVEISIIIFINFIEIILNAPQEVVIWAKVVKLL